MLLYTETPLKFAFSHDETDLTPDSVEEGSKNRFGIIGVPFDSTSTYKPGARYGPNMVREASYNLERYNLLLKKKLDVIFYDFGNVNVIPGNFRKTSEYLESTIEEIKEVNLIPIGIGGEHTVSYGLLSGLKKVRSIRDVTIIHFDAHMDLRDEYIGEKYSHATVMRRIWELNPQGILQIGVRSCSEREVNFAEDNKVEYYTSYEVKSDINRIKKVISNIKNPVYVTIDIDILDPAYAPSVGTPTPIGLDPIELQRLIYCLQDKEIIGLDLVEVSSNSNGDITSINAAQIIYDFLSLY